MFHTLFETIFLRRGKNLPVSGIRQRSAQRGARMTRLIAARQKSLVPEVSPRRKIGGREIDAKNDPCCAAAIFIASQQFLLPHNKNNCPAGFVPSPKAAAARSAAKTTPDCFLQWNTGKRPEHRPA
ncbi:hypothetical protein H8S23_10780 [Anaerofilum sp. BX8]|uniref:Uncharacterized protein n=1 Tax=Anaerofilum hominis TaxID=2763016 RepID=A0A923I8U9_9FIRM|nr:hypothetical protein [Anaerofilum hominis]MBC5581989.1 hypothetical protein [Anaerofilum hominis]